MNSLFSSQIIKWSLGNWAGDYLRVLQHVLGNGVLSAEGGGNFM